MRDDKPAPMGGEGKIVEADETYIGKQDDHAQSRGPAHRNVVVTLVEGGGWVAASTSIADIILIVRTNVRRQSIIMTDEAPVYRSLGKEYLSHDAVIHGRKKYVRYTAEDIITTNTVERLMYRRPSKAEIN